MYLIAPTSFVARGYGPVTPRPQYEFEHDGEYLFIIHLEGEAGGNFEATVDVEIKGGCYRFLAVDS